MKKFACILSVLLILTLLLTACGGNGSSGASSDPAPPPAGNVHEGSFYKITLPEGWSGEMGMYTYGGDYMKSLSLDASMDALDGLDTAKAADFLGAESAGDVAAVKAAGFDAFKYIYSGEGQKVISYMFNAYDFTVMIYYNTNQVDDAVIAAIEAMEIFEKTGDSTGGGGFDDPLGNPDPLLAGLIEQLYANVSDLPLSENWELTPDNFKSFLFIDYIEDSKGVASQAMMSTTPHAVVLLELPTDADTAAVAAEIKAAADPSKWICVSAEKFDIFTSGQYIVLVMSYEAVVDGVGANVSAVLG